MNDNNDLNRETFGEGGEAPPYAPQSQNYVTYIPYGFTPKTFEERRSIKKTEPGKSRIFIRTRSGTGSRENLEVKSEAKRSHLENFANFLSNSYIFFILPGNPPLVNPHRHDIMKKMCFFGGRDFRF